MKGRHPSLTESAAAKKGFSALAAPAQHVKLISDSMLPFLRLCDLGGGELILIKAMKNATPYWRQSHA